MDIASTLAERAQVLKGMAAENGITYLSAEFLEDTAYLLDVAAVAIADTPPAAHSTPDTPVR